MQKLSLAWGVLHMSALVRGCSLKWWHHPHCSVWPEVFALSSVSAYHDDLVCKITSYASSCWHYHFIGGQLFCSSSTKKTNKQETTHKYFWKCSVFCLFVFQILCNHYNYNNFTIATNNKSNFKGQIAWYFLHVSRDGVGRNRPLSRRHETPGLKK